MQNVYSSSVPPPPPPKIRHGDYIHTRKASYEPNFGSYISNVHQDLSYTFPPSAYELAVSSSSDLIAPQKTSSKQSSWSSNRAPQKAPSGWQYGVEYTVVSEAQPAPMKQTRRHEPSKSISYGFGIKPSLHEFDGEQYHRGVGGRDSSTLEEFQGTDYHHGVGLARLRRR